MLALAGGELIKVASSAGGEWAGPCPVCGGEDRFHVQPQHKPEPRWLCRHCTGGAWRSAVDLLKAVHRLPFHVQRFTRDVEPSPPDIHPTPPNLKPSTFNFQPFEAVELAIRGLWNSSGGEAALEWLEGRGLSESTLRYFLIGWSAGFRVGDVYVPEGVVIPCLDDEQVYYLKIALLPGQRVRCGCGKQALARKPCPHCARVAKYAGVKGNRAGLFNAQELNVQRSPSNLQPVLFVEGEFDCMAAWQQVRDQIAVVTLGSASGRLDLMTWAGAILKGGALYALYDNDPAGEQGRKALRETLGPAWWMCICRRNIRM